MNSLPESNFINPAIQTDCKFFVGLPLISSVHVNLASNAFNVAQAISPDSMGTSKLNLDFNPDDLSNQNYTLSEAHVVLLALGMLYNDYYFSFTITEKNNQAAIYTDELASFYLEGNSSFEGKWMDLIPSGVFSNHLREYSLGVSRTFSDRLQIGMKAKVLFGKMNIETDRSQIHLYSLEDSNEILFDIDLGVNSSMPYSLQVENPNEYRFSKIYPSSLNDILMSSENPGFALDLGFIYKLNNRITLSGSILDLGFIRYKSNLTNYSLRGHYLYEGAWGDYPGVDTLAWEVFDELNANLENSLTNDPYINILDPKLYLGVSYKINYTYSVNALLYNRIFSNHIQTGGTISFQAKPTSSINACVSWSYMNNSFYNFGIGIDYRKNPFQVYLVSDNILGVIMPNNFNNANIRIGFNLFFGCNKDQSTLQSGWGHKEVAKFNDLRYKKNGREY